MAVYTFVCRKSGGEWSAKQTSDGDLESSGSTTYELQRNVIKTVLSSDNSGGVSSSFSLVTPDSVVFQDADASIRKRALELVYLLVNETNVKPLTKELIEYLEKINKETIEGLSNDIKRLEVQVVDLEESRNDFLQENQQLLENASDANARLHNLERSMSSAPSSDQLTKLASENKELNSQIEAGGVLIENLITENAELV